MLEELTVRNFALIDHVNIRFGPSFNVLSGETGAGKSILIDALSFALGGKGDGGSVRDGTEEAEVSAIIRIDRLPEIQEWIGKYGIEPEDETMIIRRTLRNNGRTTATVQNVPVTRGALTELSDLLIDIHGQHEHQSLFNVATHRILLDRFAGIEARVREFTALFTELTGLRASLESLDRDEEKLVREADYLRFAVGEIETARLRPGEEEELSERQKVLARHEELVAGLQQILDLGSEARGGAMSRFRSVRERLEKSARIDPALSGLIGRFDNAFYEIEDILEEVRRRSDGAQYDPGELAAIDERLSLIATLEKKYGGASIDDVLTYARNAAERIEGFDRRDEERAILAARRDEVHERVVSEAAAVSAVRRSASSSLQERTESHLRALGMTDARFVVELGGKRNAEGRPVIGSYGADTVEFRLSANRGEVPKPLASVASGGELSRVMLAIKTVLSESDTVHTMIFDEVDTGIGGEVARSVGQHLHDLSTTKQVFCITHLASIAVFADNHLQVDKDSNGERTVTRVHRVEGADRVREISRMLAGDREGTASLDHAARLLEERGWATNRTGAGV